MGKKSYSKISQEDETDSTPPKTVNIFSYITFSWLSNLLKTASQRPLKKNDLPRPPGQTSTRKCLRTYKHLWNKQLTTNKPPKLWKVLVQSLDKCQVCSILVVFFVFRSCRILQPVFLNLILKELMQNEDELVKHASGQAFRRANHTSTTKSSTSVTDNISQISWQVVLYVIGLSTVCLIQAFIRGHLYYLGALTASHVKSGFIGLVYDKVCNLPCISRNDLAFLLECMTNICEIISILVCST